MPDAAGSWAPKCSSAKHSLQTSRWPLVAIQTMDTTLTWTFEVAQEYRCPLYLCRYHGPHSWTWIRAASQTYNIHMNLSLQHCLWQQHRPGITTWSPCGSIDHRGLLGKLNPENETFFILVTMLMLKSRAVMLLDSIWCLSVYKL